MFGYLCRRLGLARVVQKKKNVLQPGSADTGKSSVSWRPGSLGTRGACGEAMRGKKVIGSAPDQATKQRLSAACFD
jgi:hypothetical protein